MTAPSEPAAPDERRDRATISGRWTTTRLRVYGVTSWLASGFRKQHRTIASYINIFLRNGFELTGFDE